MSEELKPCPFCGSSALSIKPNIHTGLLRVQCEACWAVTATSVSSNNRRTAIAAWNRRASPSTEGEGGDARELAQRVIDTWGDGNPPIVVLARALLSSPDARREALEEAAAVADELRAKLASGEITRLGKGTPEIVACNRIAAAIRALKETKP